MKLPFKKRLWKVVLIVLGGFLVLFTFRFIYGYTTGMAEVREEYFSDFLSDEGSYKHNYASDNYKIQRVAADYAPSPSAVAPAQPQAQEYDVNQKYEKTATVKSKSTKYDDDEKKVRDRIKAYNAIIQYEQSSGQKGSRELNLLVGIPPEKFDTFYIEMLSIGAVKTKEITKIDKTNEFKNLNAKRASLESIRTSLLELRRQSGKIEEFVNLQNRILEIEQELQSLGVLLGDFDEENEFCSVRFSLLEGRGETKISMLHRIKTAFEWAIQYYLLFLCIAAAASVFSFFFLLIIDKLIPGIINRINQ
jgi:hypothetical protein